VYRTFNYNSVGFFLSMSTLDSSYKSPHAFSFLPSLIKLYYYQRSDEVNWASTPGYKSFQLFSTMLKKKLDSGYVYNRILKSSSSLITFI